MNRRLIIRLQGALLLLEALLMLPALLISLYYKESSADAFLKSMAALLVCGFPLWFFAKPVTRSLHVRDGLISVAFSWILLSLFGALPYLFSGMIPNVVDAVFESASGFTTTGATILHVLEGQPKGILFWRSFTLWIGGMGVLVLSLALLPKMADRSSHLMRAESPGPSLSKIVPRMGDMAKILYLIYGALTIVQTVVLVLSGLSLYDALIHALGTAGTGGFSNYSRSIGHFQSGWVDLSTTVFMALYGVNFALFYRMIRGSWREALRSEELRWYGIILFLSTALLTLLLLPQYQNGWTSLRHAAFQATSMLTSTGYSTQNFQLWHQGAKAILLLLMLIGACGGSTAGGLKIIRVLTLVKVAHRETQHTFHPRKIKVIRLEGQAVDDAVLSQTIAYFFLYIALVFVGTLLISLENKFSFEFNLTAALACVSNGGVGFGISTSLYSFAAYGWFSKLALVFLMLLGRLEIFPILALLHPSLWKR